MQIFVVLFILRPIDFSQSRLRLHVQMCARLTQSGWFVCITYNKGNNIIFMFLLKGDNMEIESWLWCKAGKCASPVFLDRVPHHSWTPPHVTGWTLHLHLCIYSIILMPLSVTKASNWHIESPLLYNSNQLYIIDT